MQREEVMALGDLLAEAVGGATGQIQDVHAAIAHRVFDSLGPSAYPVRVIHDGIARGSYAVARTASSAAIRAGAGALGGTRPKAAPSLQAAPRGRAALGALNGVLGDALERRGSPLALKMGLRRGGAEVPLDRRGLEGMFPDATARLAVFVHGLGETDDVWRARADSVPYGTRLQLEQGYTPLYVRYNSGRHISENGRELAALLDRLLTHWPREVQEIALIGHGMGGLVLRSACHYGAGSRWVGQVRHTFTLGSPRRGRELERVASATSSALGLLRETRPLAKPLKLRSSGIRDLRHGYLVDEDWLGPRTGPRPGRARRIPFLRTADHYFLERRLPAATGATLLAHPAIYEQISGRLRRPALPRPPRP